MVGTQYVLSNHFLLWHLHPFHKVFRTAVHTEAPSLVWRPRLSPPSSLWWWIQRRKEQHHFRSISVRHPVWRPEAMVTIEGTDGQNPIFKWNFTKNHTFIKQMKVHLLCLKQWWGEGDWSPMHLTLCILHWLLRGPQEDSAEPSLKDHWERLYVWGKWGKRLEKNWFSHVNI